MRKIFNQRLDRYLTLPAVLMAVALISAVQLMPAFAVSYSYPPYSGCHTLVNSNGASFATCTLSSGQEHDYSQINGGVGGAAVSYMGGSHVSLASGQTVTLSGISASINGLHNVGITGDHSKAQILVYLDNPNCVPEYTCSLGSQSSELYFNDISYGSWHELGTRTGPNLVYSITTSSNNYAVVAYVDTAATGTSQNTYADFYGIQYPNNYGVTNFKTTLSY